MKNSSNTMYNIGRIFTIIEIILGPIFFLLGLIFAIVAGVAPEEAGALAGPSGVLIGYGIWFIVGGILCLVFVGKAKRELANENNKDLTPFILTIVFGAIAGNVFYVLAGIFGIVAESQQRNNIENKEEPKAEEEPKE